MRKLLVLLFFVVLSGFVSATSAKGNRLLVGQPQVRKDGDSVRVSFRIDVDRDCMNKRRSILILPAVRNDDGMSAYFAAVIVEGKRSKVAEKRYLRYSDRSSVPEDVIYMKDRVALDYSAAVLYRPWMEGAEFTVETIDAGCYRYKKLVDQVLIPDLHLKARIDGVSSHFASQRSTDGPKSGISAEKEIFTHPYIFEYNEQDLAGTLDGNLYDEDRENAPTLYFSGNNTTTGSFQDKERPFSGVMPVLRSIMESERIELRAIVVAGYAAPSEDFSVSDRRGWERAVTLKKYLMESCSLPTEVIHVYNGSEDWAALRAMIEHSHYDWTAEAVRIIDTTPVTDASGRMVRLEKLQKLNGGAPYRFISENYFPKLRRASVLKIYVSPKTN